MFTPKDSLHSEFPLRPASAMNPAQPNAEDARFRALEQACADSLAVQENTQKQIDALLKGFQHLEKLMQANIPSIPPQIHPPNQTHVQSAPSGRTPPSGIAQRI